MYVSPIVHSLFLPFPLHCFDSSSLLLRPKIPPPTFFVKPTNKTQNRHFLSLSKPTPDSSDFNLNSSLDDTTNNFDTEPSVSSTDLEIETASEDDVDIEIIKLGKNSRRIACGIAIDANLEAVWNILTDYERLADFIPGLAVCQLLEKTDNRVRLFQIGQQNLAFGLKFNAKGIVDCYEKDIERIPFGQRRDIDFKMIEGDFQVFEGKWSIEEKNNERQSYGSQEIINTSLGREFQTTLSYVVDVKPKLWLPVAVVEGRLSREMKLNLLCIREQAEKAVQGTLRTL